MRWTIDFDLECSLEKIDSIRHNLYAHHSILRAEPIKETGIYKNGVETPLDINKNRLQCIARVFHKEDVDHFKTYVDKLVRVDGKVIYHDPPLLERVRTVFNAIKFSPVIIFVILLAHEAIIITGHEKIDPWISAVIFSLVGSVSVFIIDSLVLWKESF